MGTIAAIRPAATVVVARPAADGPARAVAGDPFGARPGVEVLALRRSAASRFAPGFVVFPGGVVEDGDAALARRWFGQERELARACALRELAEETGLILTANGLVEAPGRLPGAEGLSPPPVRAMPEMARWVAPEFLPVRFDARFFAIAAPFGVDPRPDGVEVDAGWWARPQALLAAHRAGDAPLMWPTLKTLQALAGCRSVQDVLGLRVRQVPPPRGPLPPGTAL